MVSPIHELAGSETFRLHTSSADISIVEPTRTVTLELTVVATTPPNEEPPERIARYERTTAAVPSTPYWRSPPSFRRPITGLLSVGIRRYTERRMVPGDDVTVVGHVTETGDGISLLVVSNRSVGQTGLRMAKTLFVGVAVGVVAVVLWLVLL